MSTSTSMSAMERFQTASQQWRIKADDARAQGDRVAEMVALQKHLYWARRAAIAKGEQA